MSNFVKRDLISETLQARIADLKRGPNVIQGSLKVTAGHDYWWYLEYGTGPFHQGSEGELDAPEDIDESAATREPYEIEVQDAKLLVYLTREGQRKFKRATIHPGIRPIGFLRASLFDAEIMLKGQITKAEKRRKKWDELPGREQLVGIVNAVMTYLLRVLQNVTPPNSDEDPYHKGRRPVPLAQAWRITKAK